MGSAPKQASWIDYALSFVPGVQSLSQRLGLSSPGGANIDLSPFRSGWLAGGLSIWEVWVCAGLSLCL